VGIGDKNMDIQEYRQAILDDLLARTKQNGEPAIDEPTAIQLLNELKDNELKEGMLFNEPSDVADVLLETSRL